MKSKTTLKRGSTVKFEFHSRIQDNGNGSVTFANFTQFLTPLAENVSPDMFVKDDVAKEKCDDLRKMVINDHFNNTQLGLDELGYWKCSSIYSYQHNDSNLSSTESDGDNFMIVGTGWDGIIRPAYNKFVETANRKSSWLRDAIADQEHPLMHVYVPYTGAPWSDCSKVFYWFPLVSPAKFNFNCEESAPDFMWKPYRPMLSISGPTTVKAGEAITLVVNVTDPETGLPLKDGKTRNVFIEEISGYINKNRVAVGDLGAHFSFRALDLEAGDKARLKLGWKNFSGLVDYNITIT